MFHYMLSNILLALNEINGGFSFKGDIFPIKSVWGWESDNSVQHGN